MVALQETKFADEAFPTAEIERLGYEALHVGDGRWNGVALLSRVGLVPVVSRAAGPERIAADVSADCGPLRVVSVYVPNGRIVDDPQYATSWSGSRRCGARSTPRPGRSRW